jgi:hypothetical protein
MLTLWRHCCWLLFLAGCTTRPDTAPGTSDHVHRITTTVTVTDAAVLPTADVDIPVFSTVVWRNRGSSPMHVDIAAAACGRCETVLGFEPTAAGARSLPIAPGSVATICFHERGDFPFVVSGAREHRGTIRVGEAR